MAFRNLLFQMIFEFLSTTVVLVLTLSILWLIKFTASIFKEMKKFANIPGTTPKGIKGFFLGDIPTIMEQDQKGISLHKHLENL